MGAWGVNLFQNDIGMEAKQIFVDFLKVGKTDAEAIELTIKECADYIRDEEDKVDFWLGFASVLFDYGRLTEEIKERALSLIGVEEDLSRWDKKDLKKRIQYLDSFKEKLNSEMPPRKKVSLAKKITPKINPNDIYYFRLDSEDCKDKIYYNCYVLILVDRWEQYDVRYGLGDEFPLVYLKLCRDIPHSAEEINSMPCFQLSYDEFGEKRVLLMEEGFSKMRKRLAFHMNFVFDRDTTSIDNDEHRDRIYEVDWHTGNELWHGNFTLWCCLERDIRIALDNSAKPNLLIYGF